MTEKDTNKPNAIQEIHQTYNRSVWTLALQLFNAFGVVAIMVFVFNAAEWKGQVDADRVAFSRFMEKGDRYPLSRGTALEGRVDSHIAANNLELKELRKEWITEMREMRKSIAELQRSMMK